MTDFTRILKAIQQGDAKAAGELIPLIYDELHRLAASKMAREAPGHTLQATALVHEAWLRLGGAEQQPWSGHAHFLAAAAQAMRQILIESARRKGRLKHGGDLQRVNINEVDLPSPMPDDELLALDASLTKLAEVNPDAATLVQLCFFTGLTQAEAAEQLGVSVATAERTWAFARAWLFRETRRELKNP